MKPRKLQIVFVLIFLGLILSYFGIRGWQQEVKEPVAAPESSHSRLAEPVASPRASVSVSVSVQASPGVATARDHELDRLLVDILRTKNDNDPRMDTEFKHLSPGTKALLKERYAAYPPEARNERGTIVFILGRDLPNSGTSEDFVFFDQVANEPPCLSLGDCGKVVKSAPEDAHEESAIGVTLSYPQQMLVHTLGDFVTQNHDNPLRDDAIRSLQGLSRSPISSVAARAQRVLGQLSN
jgi:hypothetical protein